MYRSYEFQRPAARPHGCSRSSAGNTFPRRIELLSICKVIERLILLPLFLVLPKFERIFFSREFATHRRENKIDNNIWSKRRLEEWTSLLIHMAVPVEIHKFLTKAFSFLPVTICTILRFFYSTLVLIKSRKFKEGPVTSTSTILCILEVRLMI